MTVTSGPQLRKVRTLQGQSLEVMGQGEEIFYKELQRKYRSEFTFTQVSDLADLDRLVFLELLVYRWTSWLASGKDYDGFITDGTSETLRKNIKETSPLISQIKNDLGMTKSQRDREQFESVGAYIVKLKNAAKAHGIRREKQLTTALCLMNDIKSVIGTFRRSNELERTKVGFESAEDVIAWIEETVIPEYDQVDAYFREHEQKMWVGQL